jgi:hypothetical protein
MHMSLKFFFSLSVLENCRTDKPWLRCISQRKAEDGTIYFGWLVIVGFSFFLKWGSPASASISAHVSPVSSSTKSWKLERTFSLCRSRHESVKISNNTMGAYDNTLNNMTSVMNQLYSDFQYILLSFYVWESNNVSILIATYFPILFCSPLLYA